MSNILIIDDGVYKAIPLKYDLAVDYENNIIQRENYCSNSILGGYL